MSSIDKLMNKSIFALSIPPRPNVGVNVNDKISDNKIFKEDFPEISN